MKVSIPGRKMQEEKLSILTRFQLSVTFSDDNCLLASYFPFLSLRGVVCACCPGVAHRLTHCNAKQSKMKLSLRLSLLWVLYGIFFSRGLRGKNHWTRKTGNDCRATADCSIKFHLACKESLRKWPSLLLGCQPHSLSFIFRGWHKSLAGLLDAI